MKGYRVDPLSHPLTKNQALAQQHICPNLRVGQGKGRQGNS